MGNAPGGKRRNHDDEESIPSTVRPSSDSVHAPTKKKFIMQHSHDREDPITRMLCEASISDVTSRMRTAQISNFDGKQKSPSLTAVNEEVNNKNAAVHLSTQSSGNNVPGLRPRSQTDTTPVQVSSSLPTLPTVFKWAGGGKNVFISGTFNAWKAKIPMVKSTENFYTIIDLPEGEHQYKFIVDGQWKVDNHQTTTTNNTGAMNNMIVVRPTDFDVLDALHEDMAESKSQNQSHTHIDDSYSPKNRRRTASVGGGKDSVDKRLNDSGRNVSPPGEYGQVQPLAVEYNTTADEKNNTPPLLPPHLMQVILNKSTGPQCDPNLLPHPNHVMVNHLYALSIKDGMIVLSTITRYRKKFVSTVIYKPL